MSKPKKKLVKPTSYYERKAAGKALFIPTTEEVAARYKAQ
jgi:hypothetical protein